MISIARIQECHPNYFKYTLRLALATYVRIFMLHVERVKRTRTSCYSGVRQLCSTKDKVYNVITGRQARGVGAILLACRLSDKPTPRRASCCWQGCEPFVTRCVMIYRTETVYRRDRPRIGDLAFLRATSFIKVPTRNWASCSKESRIPRTSRSIYWFKSCQAAYLRGY